MRFTFFQSTLHFQYLIYFRKNSFSFERHSDEQLIQCEDCLRRRCSFLLEWTLKNQTNILLYLLTYLLATVTWRHAMAAVAAGRDKKLYVSFNIPSQKHVIIHAHCSIRSVHLEYGCAHGKFRLSWTLKDECQFHVKSLSFSLSLRRLGVRQFLFSLSPDQTKGSSSLTYMTGARKYRKNMFIDLLHMNCTLPEGQQKSLVC